MKMTFHLILLVTFCWTALSFNSLINASSSGQKLLIDSVPKLKEPEMVLVEGGSYMMGQTSDSKGQGLGNTNLTRQVSVSTFGIGKYEVTQAEWKSVMGDSLNFSLHQDCNDCPVEEVSWNEIQFFIRKLNAATGKRYQLPTAAQWEFAARGGNKSKKYKYAGSDNVDEVVTSQRIFVGQAHPVGKNHPNELGIYNMSGNVAEWCLDFFNPDLPLGPNTDPQGPPNGYGHVIRGGSWGGHPEEYQVTSARMAYANDRSAHVGFRLALTQ